MTELNAGLVAIKIDHSILNPNTTELDLISGLQLAQKYNPASLCVRPCDISTIKRIGAEKYNLNFKSYPKLCTVVGFPHGSNTTRVKVTETIEALSNGATEIDMVINIGKALNGDWKYIENEIGLVRAQTNKTNATLKVIVETCFLNIDYLIALCAICNKLNVNFMKTSTGFGKYGARPEDIVIMKTYFNGKIKASGGIKHLSDYIKFSDLGCERIGTSSTQIIMNELNCLNGLSKSIEEASGEYL